MAGQAYAVATGKERGSHGGGAGHALAIGGCRGFAPDRVAEFDELIADALNKSGRRCRRPSSESGPAVPDGLRGSDHGLPAT